MRHTGIIRQEFPDFDIESSFQAALTLYHMQLKARVLEFHELSVIARFMLRTISLSVHTVPEIAHLLGLEEGDLASAGAELLMAGLIAQSDPDTEGRRGLRLTDEGQRRLSDEQMLARPRQITLHLHYEPLTQAVRDRDRRAVGIEQIRKEGVYVLPTRGAPPTIGDIPLAAAKAALDASPGTPARFELVSLGRLDRVFVEYLAGIQIYLLRHKQSGERRVAAFDGVAYQAEISEIVQERYEKREWAIPDEAIPEPAAALDVLLDLPRQAARIASQISAKDREIEDLRLDIAAQQKTQSQTSNTEERRMMAERIAELEDHVRRQDNERADLAEELKKAASEDITVLSTEEHRPLLVDALQKAEQGVIIVSPWLNTRTVDSRICELVRQAVSRGVRVCIGYGFGSDRPGAENDRQRMNARAVIERLRRAVGQAGSELLVVRDFRNTHEKILICDRKYVVVGSFNWLSYRGDKDEEFRRETGCRLQSEQAVDKALARLGDAFNTRDIASASEVTD